MPVSSTRKEAAASEEAKVEGRGVTAMSVVAVTKEGAKRHARARRNGHVGYGGYRKEGARRHARARRNYKIPITYLLAVQ